MPIKEERKTLGNESNLHLVYIFVVTIFLFCYRAFLESAVKYSYVEDRIYPILYK